MRCSYQKGNRVMSWNEKRKFTPRVCPEGHIDTYIYDSSKDGLKHGVLLMCNGCEDGYQLKEHKE